MLEFILAELAEVFAVEVATSVITKVICKDSDGREYHQIRLISNLPGRVRMKIPGIKGSQETASKIENILKAQPWIQEAKANQVTGTLLVNYSQNHASPRIIEHIAQLALTDSLYSASNPATTPSRKSLPGLYNVGPGFPEAALS